MCFLPVVFFLFTLTSCLAREPKLSRREFLAYVAERQPQRDNGGGGLRISPSRIQRGRYLQPWWLPPGGSAGAATRVVVRKTRREIGAPPGRFRLASAEPDLHRADQRVLFRRHPSDASKLLRKSAALVPERRFLVPRQDSVHRADLCIRHGEFLSRLPGDSWDLCSLAGETRGQSGGGGRR